MKNKALRVAGAALERLMSYCDFAALERTPLERDPFDFVVVPDFLKSDLFPSVLADYPKVPGPGSHPPAESPSAATFRRWSTSCGGPPSSRRSSASSTSI